MRFWTGSEWMSDAVVRLSVQLNTHVHVDPDLVDQTGLIVSQDNSCRFCFGAQRVFLRALGMREERISRLEQDMLVGDWSEQEIAAMNYARRLSRSQPLASEGDLETLRAVGFSEREIIELSGHVATHLFFNRISTFAALPPRALERMPDAWWMRLFQPVVKPFFSRMRKSAAPVTLTDAERVGPFSSSINALDGLPMASTWRLVVDRALAANELSPHAGPLAFAVVARALGCEASEREAVGLLEERGMAADQAQSLLATLSGEGVSEIDHIVATFARETVWYLPARIQRRVQAIREKLSREQLLELIGIVSLANSVCRLGVIARSEP